MGKVFKALNKAAAEKNCTVAEAPPEPAETAPAAQPSAEPVQEKKDRILEPVAVTGAWDERLMLATTVTGPAAESFRTLRTRILHPLSGEKPRTLLVTSAAPGEGKSFVCANLGICLAQGVDNYSLLVDCDLRKPSLHRTFGLPGDRGLVDHLRDGEDLGRILTNCGIKKLSLLPAGAPPVNPAELLGASSMARLVNELADRYDDRIILFDSPPVQAASETLILAKQVDGIIFVVRWSGTRREHVQDLLDTIGREKIVGVVFNAYRSTLLDSKLFGAYEYQQNYYYGVK